MQNKGLRFISTAALVASLLTPLAASPANAAPKCAGRTASSPAMLGTNGPDTINGTSGNDVIIGLGGADLIDGMGGKDIICAGGGDDEVALPYNDTTFADKVFGQGGNDYIATYGGNDLVSGGDGSDTLYGGFDDDRVLGGTGDDFLYGEGNDDEYGNDDLDGGPGVDWAGWWLPVTANLEGGTAAQVDNIGSNDTLKNVENLFGSDYGDTLIGDDANNYFVAGDGNDTVWGRGGDDILDGGLGSDALYGQVGQFDWSAYFFAPQGVEADLKVGNSWTSGTGTDDAVAGGTDCADHVGASTCDKDELNGIEILAGSSHDDKLYGDSRRNYLNGYDGDDLLDGREGLDVATYFYSSTGVNVRLDLNSASGEGADTLKNVEGAWGSNLDDEIYGDANNNLILGGAGDDLMKGGDGDDYFIDDAGYLQDGSLASGRDDIFGEGGTYDVVDFFLGVGGVKANLTTGTIDDDSDFAGTLDSIEGLIGSNSRDILTGDANVNYIFGEGGNDDIFGLAGADQLNGGPGSNKVNGGADSDHCINGTTTACEAGGPVDLHPLVKLVSALGRIRSHRPNTN